MIKQTLKLSLCSVYAKSMNGIIPDQYNVENRLNQLERMYKPTLPYPPQPTQPNMTVDWVKNVDGVSSYPVKFGGSVLLIDPQSNMMYLKVVDYIGTVKISAYSFKEVNMPNAQEQQNAEVGALSERIATLEKIIISMTQKDGANVQQNNGTTTTQDNTSDGATVFPTAETPKQRGVTTHG